MTGSPKFLEILIRDLRAISWRVLYLPSFFSLCDEEVLHGISTLIPNRLNLVAVFDLHFVEEEIIKYR